MAISIANTGLFSANGDISGSFDCSGGNGLVLFVYTEGIITGATYNGVAMTYQTEAQIVSSVTVSVYTLASPASGSNTLAVEQDPGTVEVQAYAVALSGCNAADLVEGSGTEESDTSTNATMTVTVTQANGVPSMIVMGMAVRAQGEVSWDTTSPNIELFESDYDSGTQTLGAAYQTFNGSGSKSAESTYLFGSGFNSAVGAGVMINGIPVPPAQIIEY